METLVALVDTDGWPVATRLRWIRSLPEYAGHIIDIDPIASEQTGLIGGYQIHHGACCPRRLDARIIPDTICTVALIATDLPRILAALENHPDDGSWPRRQRVIDKLRGMAPKGAPDA